MKGLERTGKMLKLEYVIKKKIRLAHKAQYTQSYQGKEIER